MKRILLLALSCILMSVTANVIAAPITGILTTCVGSSTPLFNTVPGGTWISSTPGVANVGITDGVVAGVSMGTATISYITGFDIATTVVTVGPAPVITGPSTICTVGGTITLVGTPPGGTWASGFPPGDVTVGATTGLVTAISPGGAPIFYAISPTCTATHVVHVEGHTVIVGPDTLCLGSTASYSWIVTDTDAGLPIEGTWSSSDTGVITFPPGIEMSTATAHGVGSAVITYTHPSGCFTIKHVFVRAGGGTITGIPRVCIGGTTTLSGSPSGGTWSSSAPTIASVGSSSGVVTGFSPGTATVTYTAGGCSATRIVTVGMMPAPITGPSTVCAGATITLSNTSAGGTWTSSNTAIATIDPMSGVVTGVSPGVVNITYSTGCEVFKSITVNPAPSTITGSATICLGTSSTYSSATPGGTWSSSTPAVVTINAAGVATGVGLGSATIFYTLPTGCYVTFFVVVTSSSAVISGPGNVCTGLSITLSATPAGGTWSSATPAVATVGSAGLVTGISPGTAIISYSISGCATTKVVTVTAGPSAISGSNTICPGGTSLYTSSPAGGTWSTANPAVATINSATGMATGVSAGFTFITYTLPSGCYAIKTVTVTATATTISGSSTVCVGGITTWVGTPSGGTWVSSTPSIATVTSTGIVSGNAVGSTTITYTAGTCSTTKVISVQAAPSTIAGPDSVCIGSTTTLTSTPAGGVWTSGTPAVATINAAGVVTAVSTGLTFITYTLSTGCSTTKALWVTSGGVSISGGSSLCEGGALALSGTPAGGLWSSSNPLVASVGSTGIVVGTTAGTAIITYSQGGCLATRVVTVTAAPAAISGSSTVCVGATTTLTNTTPGGTWSITPTTVATISASGVVTGLSVGSAVVTYAVGSCFTTTTIAVTPGPGPITGTGSICVGGSLTLSNATPGGFWSSANATIASVDGTTGVVTGLSSGTATISYTAAGCTVTTSVTVVSTPATISGPSTVCTGSSATYTNSVGGGSWSVSNATIATIGASTGVLTGVTTGVVTISYSISGCIATKVVSVTATPAPIAGPSSVCVGQTITLTNSAAGGTWTSTAPTKATVNASTGVVTGVATGAATIQYTTSCGTVSKTISVNAAPSAISGAGSLCVGTSSVYTTSTTGGVWSSSNTAIATITSTGIVTAVAPGVVTISYTKSGCSATKTVTVNAVPGPIGGSSIVCVGSTITLTNSVPGGTWASGNPLKATVDASTGVVTGVATGTLNVYYSIGGCMVSKALTVNASPSDIIGPSSLCAGSTITLASLTTGGTWSSSNTAIATVTTTTGLVSGVSAGVVTISYTKLGCSKTKSVTVNATPAAIAGSSTVCVGSTITLTNTVPGGTWTSSSPSRATVNSSGVVTGISAGTVVISYSTPCGTATKTVTVNASLPAITGSTTLCEGFTTTLSNTVAGGTWTSSNTSVATVNLTTGVVTGLTAGTAMITYSTGGCAATVTVTVNATPSPIGGVGSVCAGGSLTLTNATPGGTWSSSNVTVATVSAAAGVVTGVAAGTSTITYTLATGCFTTAVVTVSSGPSPIMGSSTICVGSATSITSSPAGGMWSSSNPSVASVGSTAGLVTGVAPGVAIITYSIGGCLDTFMITVTASAAAISGPPTVCAGGTATYSNSTPGGIWTSSNTTVATIGSTSGILTGVTTGVTVITYSASGCVATMTVSVSAGPTVIMGPATICAGTTTTLTSTPAGGMWTSSTPSVATIGSTSGMVTGVVAGTTMITYAVGACSVTRGLTVNAAAGPISGPATVCAGGTITLTGGTPGGVWLSGNVAIASIDSVSGVLTGNSAGVVSIYYIVGSCSATRTVTVTAGPPAIGGPSSVCVGSTITLTNSTAGGIWSSSNTSVAAVTVTSGVVFGVAPGTATITYTVGSCSVTKTITVITAPAAITGSSTVCAGSSTLLTNATPGGSWSSSNTAVAAVSGTSGLVTGISAGTATITYSIGGCFVTFGITVSPAPLPIAGPSSVCAGSSITLTDATPGGAWSSSSPTIATVSLGGVVTGLSSGVVTITYSVGGCSVTKLVTVNATPSAISGASSVCTGATTTFTNAVPGGVWSSSNPAVASVGASTGIVTGVTAGAAIITYSIGGCFAVKTIGVTTGPSAISGPSSLCVGSSASLTSTPGGGVWSSSNISVASVGTSGFVTAVGPGVVTITYSMGGCDVTKVISVNSTPAPISGGSSVCVGSTMTLSNSVPGGIWTSSNPSIAAVSTVGVVTGVSTGGVIITYSIGGCFVVRTVAVLAAPAPIVGGSNICIGTPLVLTDATPGGIWSVSAPSIATVSTGGVVNGVSAGAVTVSYTVGGCSATKPVSVNVSPSAIAGPSSVCAGSSVTLTNTVPGGVWSSSNSAIASVSTAGVVTGNVAGAATITYSIGSCFATVSIVVNANPGAISGAGSVCAGSSTTFTNPVPGGVWSSASPAVATIGATTGVVTGVTSGTAIVTYSIGGCFAIKKIMVVTCSSFGIGKETAVDNVTTQAPSFSVFPNPASGYINISWDSEIGNADIIVSDVAGREVSRFSTDGRANGNQQIDVTNLTDGMYMISVRSETVQYTSRIIVRR